jgi:DNA adenine methylase
MFYVGDKFKLISEIKDYFPPNIDKFIEPFVGGGTVFLNINSNEYLLNDINSNVIDLHLLLNNQQNLDKFLADVLNITEKYNLSRSFSEDILSSELKQKHKKTYYAIYNKKGYNQLKAYYNNSKNKDPFLLYLLVIYGFNRMFRFNSKNEFNVPVGNVDFNKNVVNALTHYFSFKNEKKLVFFNLDFKEFLDSIKISNNDFVYFDPPYLITFSEYNKLWNEDKEIKLLEYLDYLNSKNIKFAISNVTDYKGRENLIFKDWMKRYKVHSIKSNYISYHDNTSKSFNEVLVINY